MNRHWCELGKALVGLWVVGLSVVGAPAAQQVLQVVPAQVTLDNGLDTHRLVAVRSDASGITADVTAAAQVTFAPAGVAAWRDGRLYPVADGETVAQVRCGELTAEVAVVVRGAELAPQVSFRNDVVPILTRAGCNSGACHGAAAGKNGFRLTLFGYDPGKDLRCLTREQHARRVDCADPEQSLMLTKPTGEVKHKGGVRLERDGEQWRKLRSWILDGAVDDGAVEGDAKGRAAVPQLVQLTVEPRELVLAGPGQRAGLVVTARYDDGSLRDVTDLALLSSSSTTSAKVEGGQVESGQRGEAFVMARFGFLAEVAQVIVLPDAAPWQAPPMTAVNEIDALVQQKLQKLRLAPAERCDDATFVRRAFIDVIGQLPSVEDVRAFVADAAPDKRVKLVDALLERPEFADVQAMAWAEVLRVERDRLGDKGVQVFTRWLREAMRDGVPIDEVVRRMLTAEGSAFEVPETNYWVVTADPKVLAENAAQTFFGIRLQCAQCHNHPFERWRMDDYYGFAAFFAQVARKGGEDPRDTIVYGNPGGRVANARTGVTAAPRYLGGDAPQLSPGESPRVAFARWLTDKHNPWFAQNVANRVWARFFGRGLVEPVDDVRVSNPPSHPELHRRLGEKLAAADFDVRTLIREICASNTYQSAQHPEQAPAATYAGMPPRRLSAEQLLDAIGALTGVPSKFRGVPLGESAVQVVDANAQSRFLELFGRPRRESVCTCERREEPTLNQVLHLINGDTVEQKVRSKDGRLQRLLQAQAAPAQILEQLFLAAYARPPRDDERERMLRGIAEAGADPAAAWQDVLWAIVNSKEFFFQH